MYQGEQLKINLLSTEEYDLTQIDFKVYVYPSGAPDIVFAKDKSECASIGERDYACIFTGRETAEFPSGSFTLEIHDKDNEVIYMNPRQFSVSPSATAIELLEEDN